MYNFSMMPLVTEHFDEMCRDIREQYERGVTTCPLFIMTLVPEGNPVWDKVGPMCEKYSMLRRELERYGIPSGVLVQASLGHGYDIDLAPFTRFLGVRDGEERNVYCPLDKDFLEHFKGVMKRIAKENPSAIMLDDDFRLLMRPGQGCACKLHMERFNKRTGKSFTREELWAHIESHPSDDELTLAFIDIQSESLREAARSFREAIDEVNPSIQGINCTSGDQCDSVVYTNPEFCGKGNPTMVRVPCGTYAPISVREFSDIMRRAAACVAKLRKHGIDIILGETDTIPFNRYGKSARYLHSHYTAAILEGVRGAKHWITRTSAWEPRSGKAYRDILAKHKCFYERLSELCDGIRFVGVNSAILINEKHDYHVIDPWRYHSNYFATKWLERVGIPFYFAEPTKSARVTFLEDCIVTHMTKEQIENAFSGSVVMTSEAADDLNRLGYNELVGVEVKDWEGIPAKNEYFEFDKSATCTAQKGRKMLIPTDERVEALSYSSRPKDGKKLPLSPAVTSLERENGKYTVVFAGTPNAPHNYMEGFSFLNESRRRQLIDILKKADALPIYYDGDAEVLLRAGRVKDGRLLACLFNLGYDPIEELDLVLDVTPREISYLSPDGEEISLDFVLYDGGGVKVMTELSPMYPIVLLIK